MPQATPVMASVVLEPVYHGTAEMDFSDSSDAGRLRAHFDRLIDELLGGTMGRSKFEKWEIDLLLDFMTCDLSGLRKAHAVLSKYRQAVHEHLANGAKTPMKLSEFLASDGHASPKPNKSKSTSV